MAMVVGTALSALGTTPALAAERAEADGRAVRDISRYCTACWRNARLDPDCWTDCTQEVFCRLLERVAPDAWSNVLKLEGDERREFLRAIDAVKKRSQRGRKWSPLLNDGVADRNDRHSREVAEEREIVRQVSDELLSPRQQRILQLSFDGWSVHEMAKELELSPERISDEKYKAIRKLREHLAT
jgi:RNA polymerase sigma factor (sigma-70 family)